MFFFVIDLYYFGIWVDAGKTCIFGYFSDYNSSPPPILSLGRLHFMGVAASGSEPGCWVIEAVCVQFRPSARLCSVVFCAVWWSSRFCQNWHSQFCTECEPTSKFNNMRAVFITMVKSCLDATFFRGPSSAHRGSVTASGSVLACWVGAICPNEANQLGG